MAIFLPIRSSGLYRPACRTGCNARARRRNTVRCSSFLPFLSCFSQARTSARAAPPQGVVKADLRLMVGDFSNSFFFGRGAAASAAAFCLASSAFQILVPSSRQCGKGFALVHMVFGRMVLRGQHSSGVAQNPAAQMTILGCGGGQVRSLHQHGNGAGASLGCKNSFRAWFPSHPARRTSGGSLVNILVGALHNLKNSDQCSGYIRASWRHPPCRAGRQSGFSAHRRGIGTAVALPGTAKVLFRAHSDRTGQRPVARSLAESRVLMRLIRASLVAASLPNGTSRNRK